MTYSNLFYFRVISHIGGTEQFLFEVARKYHKKDITILYDQADFDQLVRLRKYVRCIRRTQGERYRAIRAFYNFNLDALPFIEADEHIFICHAIYQQLHFAPPLTNKKLTRFIGVSDYACRELEKYGEFQGRKIKAERAYNPLTIEPVDRVLRIISAGRIDDKVKGGDRMLKLMAALDDYCDRTGRHYLWTIFTNKPHEIQRKISSPNVVCLEGRVDIRPFIADSDYLVQLSNDMESYCYSINEALELGTRIVRTPFSVAKELKIPKTADLVCDWDMGNVSEVAEEMFRRTAYKKMFSYHAPQDGWSDLLVDKASKYRPEAEKYRVRALTGYYDLESGEYKTAYSDSWEVSEERARKLVKLNYVEVI